MSKVPKKRKRPNGDPLFFRGKLVCALYGANEFPPKSQPGLRLNFPFFETLVKRGDGSSGLGQCPAWVYRAFHNNVIIN